MDTPMRWIFCLLLGLSPPLYAYADPPEKIDLVVNRVKRIDLTDLNPTDIQYVPADLFDVDRSFLDGDPKKFVYRIVGYEDGKSGYLFVVSNGKGKVIPMQVGKAPPNPPPKPDDPKPLPSRQTIL
jgi:hypothetical protein